jgi:NAD(P)-dependent dehydrogenase (short-subunit alcohol dehydrogenase family)
MPPSHAGDAPSTGRSASGPTPTDERRVALVTGGTSGLGLATAERLLAAGTAVVLFGRSPERGRRARDRLGDLGDLADLADRALFVAGDVTDEADIARALDAAERHGRLRVAVNCAGATHAGRVLGSGGVHPLSEFVRVVTTNLVGTFNVVRLAAERMADNEVHAGERGVIVVTSSIAAFDGQIGQAAYAAAEAGIAGMTLPLARDLAGRLIRVVSVAPGLFDTPRTAPATPCVVTSPIHSDLAIPANSPL